MGKPRKQNRTQQDSAAPQAEKPAATGDAISSEVPENLSREAPLSSREARFGLGSYVVMNLIFDAFCLLQLALVSVVLKEEKGLFFFFGLLMVAFLLVSVFDYLHDRMTDKTPETAEAGFVATD